MEREIEITFRNRDAIITIYEEADPSTGAGYACDVRFVDDPQNSIDLTADEQNDIQLRIEDYYQYLDQLD